MPVINIDRNAGASVHDQLLEQLRFQIASGQYKVDDTLPSTRKLGEQLGVSFHTVRKVYQALEQEGVLSSQPGSGYVVRERAPMAKGERMERGAAEIHDTLQRLIGLGLDEREIEYLFQEQMGLIEGAGTRYKLVVAAAFRELAERCAEQLKLHLQHPFEIATVAELARHQDADYIFSPFETLREVLGTVPRADVHGLVTYLRPDALEHIARLLDTQTLGVVTRYADALPPLMGQLRHLTGFGGQVMAFSLEDGHKPFDQQMLSQVDLLAFTPPCRRRLRPLIDGPVPSAELTFIVSRDSIEAIRQAVPF